MDEGSQFDGVDSGFWVELIHTDAGGGVRVTRHTVYRDPLSIPVLSAGPTTAAEVPVRAGLTVALGDRRGLIRKRLKTRVVAAAVASGHTAAEAEQAFEDGWVSSDRPFIDWFVNGGFEKLLEIVMNLLKLFAENT